jgi:tRNA modification GTPase
MAEHDTIVAIATPPGRGAIGIVRVSGGEVPRVAALVLGRVPPPGRAMLARFLDRDGASLDRGVALYFPAPRSFTGEHVLELQGHGGPVVLDLIVGRLVELGCRPAAPGEFSQRAVLNGRIDLAQAEAVADLIDASSAAAARAAVRSLQGEFSARIAGLRQELTALRVRIEASIDFPDEQIPLIDDPTARAQLDRLAAAFDGLQASAQRGARLVDGLTVVIAGAPNAGKSSLLNRLAGDDVAIVTELPGTTRDLLRHQVLEGGVPLHLIDTAGLRAAADVVEAEGIRRARVAIGQADLVLYVVDAAAGAIDASAIDEELARVAPGVPVTLVFNKIDLTGGGARCVPDATPPRIELSARSGAGIDLLRAHLRARAGDFSVEATALSARRRHLEALARARAHLVAAVAELQASGAAELVAEELRLAQEALGEITGEFTSDDLLGEIFASFCIGK